MAHDRPRHEGVRALLECACVQPPRPYIEYRHFGLMVQRRHSEANREVAQLERKALDRDGLSHTIPAPFVLDLEQITRALDDLVASQLRMCMCSNVNRRSWPRDDSSHTHEPCSACQRSRSSQRRTPWQLQSAVRLHSRDRAGQMQVLIVLYQHQAAAGVLGLPTKSDTDRPHGLAVSTTCDPPRVTSARCSSSCDPERQEYRLHDDDDDDDIG